MRLFLNQLTVMNTGKFVDVDAFHDEYAKFNSGIDPELLALTPESVGH
jgi:hypothetical protein